MTQFQIPNLSGVAQGGGGLADDLAKTLLSGLVQAEKRERDALNQAKRVGFDTELSEGLAKLSFDMANDPNADPATLSDTFSQKADGIRNNLIAKYNPDGQSIDTEWYKSASERSISLGRAKMHEVARDLQIKRSESDLNRRTVVDQQRLMLNPQGFEDVIAASSEMFKGLAPLLGEDKIHELQVAYEAGIAQTTLYSLLDKARSTGEIDQVETELDRMIEDGYIRDPKFATELRKSIESKRINRSRGVYGSTGYELERELATFVDDSVGIVAVGPYGTPLFGILTESGVQKKLDDLTRAIPEDMYNDKGMIIDPANPNQPAITVEHYLQGLLLSVAASHLQQNPNEAGADQVDVLLDTAKSFGDMGVENSKLFGRISNGAKAVHADYQKSRNAALSHSSRAAKDPSLDLSNLTPDQADGVYDTWSEEQRSRDEMLSLWARHNMPVTGKWKELLTERSVNDPAAFRNLVITAYAMGGNRAQNMLKATGSIVDLHMLEIADEALYLGAKQNENGYKGAEEELGRLAVSSDEEIQDRIGNRGAAGVHYKEVKDSIDSLLDELSLGMGDAWAKFPREKRRMFRRMVAAEYARTTNSESIDYRALREAAVTVRKDFALDQKLVGPRREKTAVDAFAIDGLADMTPIEDVDAFMGSGLTQRNLSRIGNGLLNMMEPTTIGSIVAYPIYRDDQPTNMALVWDNDNNLSMVVEVLSVAGGGNIVKGKPMEAKSAPGMLGLTPWGVMLKEEREELDVTFSADSHVAQAAMRSVGLAAPHDPWNQLEWSKEWRKEDAAQAYLRAQSYGQSHFRQTFPLDDVLDIGPDAFNTHVHNKLISLGWPENMLRAWATARGSK